MLIYNPSTSMQPYHFIYNERLATTIMPCFIPGCTVNDKLNLQTGTVFVCSNKLKFNPRVFAISYQKLQNCIISIILVQIKLFFLYSTYRNIVTIVCNFNGKLKSKSKVFNSEQFYSAFSARIGNIVINSFLNFLRRYNLKAILLVTCNIKFLALSP